MPGFLWGIHFSLPETICYHSMGVESIIGIPTRVVGNLLIGFLIFGVALVSTGGGNFFMDFAMSLLGHTRGGAAKVSVFSSAFMASLSGSVISNIVTTGSVTIPAMKKTGYTPRWAAAIEACASTGGTIMPPIMGAAGFLIASFLNIPYVHVMVAAFFPAFLYYLTFDLASRRPCGLYRPWWPATGRSPSILDYHEKGMVLFWFDYSSYFYPDLFTNRGLGSFFCNDISFCLRYD